ncbi:DUF4132 domain-containing protein [Actinomadura sp. 21ATH]|uniref:DUF4132 domain-containing protein n=1 Tax=Actinomadura sp. 21ATH TaxID=1735444 RepID=UPI0035C20213
MIDETALVLPESWRAQLHPRRGGIPVPEISAGPAAERPAGWDDAVEPVLGDPDQDPDLARRARAYLAGAPDPAGAAVVMAALPFQQAAGAGGPVRTWAAEHGLAFAARAFAELSVMAPVHTQAGGRSTLRNVRYLEAGDRRPHWWTGRRDGRLLRGLLARAGDREYAEAVEGLAAHRETPIQRVVVSYLVPDRFDWVEECCAAPPSQRGEESRYWWMLLCALGSGRHLEALGRAPGWALYADRGLLATVMEGLGPAAAPLLDAAADRPHQRAEDLKVPLEALALLPSDKAFGMLLDRIEHRHVPPLLVEAMDRFPARALRLLGAAAAGTSKAAGIAGELLRAHVGAHPGVAAGTAHEAGKVKEAAPADLPELLVTPPWERAGGAAAAAAGAFLAEGPTSRLPAVIPKPGPWADAARLPRVLLRDRERALPVDSARHVLTMMAMCEHGRTYPGLDVVKEVCDPGSLAGFSWAVFRWWRLNGGPPKDGWALVQLGVLGDDGTVRRLAPVIRDWPGEGGHKLAEKGLDVLAAIGTEVALMHLHGIATKVRFKGLRARAQEKVESIAADLGLTPERLGDRLVPSFGLDASGGLTLDYGPRRFHVGFDEALKPYVTDGSGKRRKSLPKPGARDDAGLAEPAYARFAALKKDVRTVAAGQVTRLEAAMVGQRRWTAAEFGTYFAGHPLIVHIARRLVWLADHAGTTTAFRIAEDRTYADVHDEPYDLPAAAEVRIAHPVQLDAATLAAWGEVFADYEILQPFPQLGRTVHVLTGEERAAGRLERFEGITVPSGAVVRLERHGWERGAPGDGGSQGWTSRPVPGGLFVVVDLDPGISIGMIDGIPEQVLEHVWIGERPVRYRYRTETGRTFGELDPLTASEVLAQLTELAGTAR